MNRKAADPAVHVTSKTSARPSQTKSGEREKYWRQVLRTFEQSGLGPSQFCRQHGINIGTFKRWRREFGISSAPSAKKSSESEQAPPNPFVAVRTISTEPVSQPADDWLEIVLPGGRRIQITERTSTQLLLKVLRALEETC